MTSRLQHTVYRVDSGRGSLVNRNAADLTGVVYFLDRTDRHQMKVGDHISVFTVSQAPEFGEYQHFRRGIPQPSDIPMVGRKVEATINDQEAIYYSFPQDADWEAKYNGSIPLQEFYDTLNEHNPHSETPLDKQVEVLEDLLENPINHQLQ